MKKFQNEDEPVLNAHLKIIYDIASYMHHKYNYDLDDLFSEGCLQYLLKMEKYQAGRGAKVPTYLWVAIRRELMNYIKFQTKLNFTVPIDDLVNEVEFFVGTNYKKYPMVDQFMLSAY